MIQNQIKEKSLKVKMCGMRRKEDIAYANEVKPDAIGYIFFSKSKQYKREKAARKNNTLYLLISNLLEQDTAVSSAFSGLFSVISTDVTFLFRFV